MTDIDKQTISKLHKLLVKKTISPRLAKLVCISLKLFCLAISFAISNKSFLFSSVIIFFASLIEP